LRRLDPKAADTIFPSDTRRIVRALEVCLKTDITLSALHRDRTQPLSYHFVKIGLTRQRSDLYRNIDQRVDAMIAEGLVAEVRAVCDMIEQHSSGDDSVISSRSRRPPLPSMQAIGYKEIASYLEGNVNLDEAIRLVKKRSRNYAKRQFTWFRKEPGISWIDVTGIGEPAAVVERVLTLLEKA
jgi:tRNA dimethylallyltransferase